MTAYPTQISDDLLSLLHKHAWETGWIVSTVSPPLPLEEKRIHTISLSWPLPTYDLQQCYSQFTDGTEGWWWRITSVEIERDSQGKIWAISIQEVWRGIAKPIWAVDSKA